MKTLKTIVLIVGVLVAALAWNTSMAQTHTRDDNFMKADVRVEKVGMITQQSHLGATSL